MKKNYKKDDVYTVYTGQAMALFRFDLPGVGKVIDAIPELKAMSDAGYHEEAEKITRRALGYCLETCMEEMKEDAETAAAEVFGIPWNRVEITMEQENEESGRVGVDNLSFVQYWDAVDLRKWQRFERWIGEDVSEMSSLEFAVDLITANNWHMPEAELYNFVDTANGGTLCLATEKMKKNLQFAKVYGFFGVGEKEEK